MIVCAINEREPFITQMDVLRNSLKANSPLDRFIFEVLSADKTRGYMTCYRTEMFVKTMLRCQFDKVAWIDADCIIRGSLDKLWEDVGENTIKIAYRPRYIEKGKSNRVFQAAVFALGNGRYIQKMIYEWNKRVQKSPEWYRDQEELYKCYLKYKDRINLIPLNKKLNDSTFRDSSIIWHSKGHHFDDPKFQREFRKYAKNSVYDGGAS